MIASTVPVTTAGWLAHRALGRAGGQARVVAALSRSVYCLAAGEPVWMVPSAAALHGHAVVAAAWPRPPAVGDRIRLDLHAAQIWAPGAFDPPPASVSRTAAARLLAELRALGPPAGFGALLIGQRPGFPLERAVADAATVARACAEDDPGAAAHAALALIGLGPGLTPAGDDYVGGAVFARVVLGDRRARPGWRAAGARIHAHARGATHPISAALLGDLVRGVGWAPLHDLALAVARDAPPGRLLEPARRLTRLGHSSGWDLLAGFLAALLGPDSWQGAGALVDAGPVRDDGRAPLR